jgi:Ran-binding protein 9/10
MDFAFPYPVQAGDTVGCGYDFRATSIFFTHNGQRLPSAFAGVYLPRVQFDVYAAIGVSGANALDVNFGGELFRWKEGNEWAWRLEGHVGRLSGPAGAGGGADDELPTYAEARVSS